MPTVAVSGGFDPPHIGHIRMILGAAAFKNEVRDCKLHCGQLHVYLNTDEWLMRKKGYVFMPFAERAEMLMAVKGVDLVIPVVDEDDTVCKTIRMFKPHIYCNGGDRLPDNTPELKTCHDLKIQVKFNVGGGKIQSSSDLVRRAKNA